MNCGKDVAGSCHGGYHTGVYELIQQMGYVPFDTCMPYMACSEDSSEGFCEHVDTTCKKGEVLLCHNPYDVYTIISYFGVY